MFTCISSARQPQPAGQPAVSPGCARCRALHKLKGLPSPIYETAILKMIIQPHHGDPFVLPSNTFFSIH